MDAVAAFLAMNGYAEYIWPAFGATAVVLIGLLIASLRTLREREATLCELQSRMKSARGEAREA